MNETTWPMLYGVALICGVGFTMSMFIGGLTFEHGGFEKNAAVRIGVIVGSVTSAVAGWLVLHSGLAFWSCILVLHLSLPKAD